MGPRSRMPPPVYHKQFQVGRTETSTASISMTSDNESVTGIFAKAKSEFSVLKNDNSLLRHDIDDMQSLFSKIMLQLDQLENQPKRRKSQIMMEAYEKRKRRNTEQLEKTFTVQPASSIVTGQRSGGTSLNNTRVCEDSVVGYGRFTPGMCSTYMQSSISSTTDLDTSIGSLQDYSLITPESDSDVHKSQVRGILKQSSAELTALSSPKSPKRRRRRAKVRFAEASDSETEDCDCMDCSRTTSCKESWDDQPELLLDDVYSTLSSSSGEEDGMLESSATLNTTDVTISPGQTTPSQTRQNLTSFATEVLFPSPWLPERRPDENASFFEQIHLEYERCCEQMKLDFPQYSPNFKELEQAEEDFCREHCPDHELHEALGETCSLLINGSMSLLENSTLELERGSESGFESTQTTLDSSVDSNHTDVSSITSAHELKRLKPGDRSADVEVHQPRKSSQNSVKTLPASLEATRGSTPDMTQVRTPDETGVQSNTTHLPSMCEMNFQVDQTKLTIPESCRSAFDFESATSSSTSPSSKSNATVLYNSPASLMNSPAALFSSSTSIYNSPVSIYNSPVVSVYNSPASTLETPCPTLVPIDNHLLQSPIAPQNSPQLASESPKLVNSPASTTSTILPLMDFETLSPMSNSATLVTPVAPKRQSTRRFPTVPKNFVRRLEFITPSKDLKRKESFTKRLSQRSMKTDKRSKIEESENEEVENQDKISTYKSRKNIKKRLKLFSNFFKKDRESESHVVETLAHI